MSARIKERFTDLYRDLVDRRLLIPAIALVVAIVAVPIVLKTDPGAPPAPLAPAADAGEATATEAAVLAEQTGIRDYRKRLAALEERNPFESPFAASESADAAAAQDPASAIAPAPEASTETSIGVTTPSGNDSSSVSVDIPDPPVSTPPVDIDDSVDVDVQVDEPKPEIRFYAPRADVSIGPIGHGKTLEGVRPLELLPNDSSPVVVFVGLAPHGEGAVFNLSPDALEVSGDGTCAPHKPSPCQFLTLKPGDDVYIKYGLKGTKTYRLKLIDAYAVRVSDPRD